MFVRQCGMFWNDSTADPEKRNRHTPCRSQLYWCSGMPEPSLRYVIVNVWRDTQSSRKEYILGRNSRSEYRLSQTGPLRALIQNHQLHSQFNLDLDARVYTTLHLPEDRSPTSFTTRVPIHRTSGR